MIRFALKSVAYLAALGVGAALALGFACESVDGSGAPATEARDVGHVADVSLSGVGELVIVPGQECALTVTADDNVLPHLVSESANGKLKLGTRSLVSLRTKTKIVYTLTVPQLSAVSVSGAATVRSERLDADELALELSGASKAHINNLTCRKLKMELSGASTARLAGSADRITARQSGATTADTVGLKAQTADLRLSGASTATVWAADELTARASGASGVRFKGAPKVERKTSGASRVRPLE